MQSSNINNFDNTFAHEPAPTHHVHRDSEVLPGARGATHVAPNYSTEVTNNESVWKDRNERNFGAGTDTGAVMAGGQHVGAPDGKNAFSEDRPLGVQPTSQGGVAIGGQDDLPMGKPSAADKLIGKTQKVAGKMMKNEAMHEKGELRESGGKAAAAGNARAPHD